MSAVCARVRAALALAAALLVAATQWRSPVLAGWRTAELAVLIAGPLVLTCAAWRARAAPVPGRRLAAALRIGAGLLAVLALAVTAMTEARFQRDRYLVLNAEPGRLARLGRHVVVGYRDLDDLRALVERRAVAGVFVTARNVEGLSADEVRSTIAALQDIRTRQGAPPLWIATDEEGGAVSRLSPPLARRPPLSSLAGGAAPQANDFARAQAYGAAQGRDLARLGINLNFAPVVDLNRSLVNPQDRYTRIYQRAISADPAVVTAVARRYCAGLGESGVRCTLKHFPGLGGVFDDTHVGGAELATALADLAAADWVPFRALMQDGTFAMLAHVRLNAVDGDRPASLSKRVVTGLLREAWGYDGVLITDDFSMGAIAGGRAGVGGAAVAALDAGVDLLLVAYDPDQYYPLMAALLRADRAGELSADLIARSAARLVRAAPQPQP